MTWVLEQIIDEICQGYEALPQGREPLPRTSDGKPLLGNLEKFKHAGHRVVWTLIGGSFGAATKIGGPEGAAYQAVAIFQVWVWQKDLEDCWNVMVDLLAAIRNTVYGPNMGALNFRSPTEEEGRLTQEGEVIIFAVNLAVPVPLVGSVPETEVTIEAHEAAITADNGEADQDGNYTPFDDAVLVTGPPT